MKSSATSRASFTSAAPAAPNAYVGPCDARSRGSRVTPWGGSASSLRAEASEADEEKTRVRHPRGLGHEVERPRGTTPARGFATRASDIVTDSMASHAPRDGLGAFEARRRVPFCRKRGGFETRKAFFLGERSSGSGAGRRVRRGYIMTGVSLLDSIEYASTPSVANMPAPGALTRRTAPG